MVTEDIRDTKRNDDCLDDLVALETACRVLVRRALVARKPGLARRFQGVLVQRWEPPQERAAWLREVAKRLLEDDETATPLMRQLRLQAG